VHSGLTSENRPAFAFLSKCYKIFNRKYKKNLKRLYIVHPTFWVRTSFALFRPFLSAKFWRKLVYINDVDELDKTIDRSQITLPRVALEHDAQASLPLQPAPRRSSASWACRSPSCWRARRASPERPLVPPLFLEQSLAYLRTNAHVEGILRLSGSILEIKKLAAAVDEGRFDAFAASLTDPHVVGGFVKLWMRELPDPVVPHALYDKFVVAARDAPPAPSIAGTDDDEPRADGPSPVTRAVEPVLKQLAAPNRRVLAALLDLCGQFHSTTRRQSHDGAQFGHCDGAKHALVSRTRHGGDAAEHAVAERVGALAHHRPQICCGVVEHKCVSWFGVWFGVASPLLDPV
jgi:hypothetical protein